MAITIGPTADLSEDSGKRNRRYRISFTKAVSDGTRDLDIAALRAIEDFSSVAPEMNGVASPGTSIQMSRANHVHPSDTSRASTTHAASHTTGSDIIADATLATSGLMSAADKAALAGLIPVGGLLWMASTTAPANFIAPSGDLLTRASYPELWEFAQASGMLATDAAWLAAGGPIGGFSSGDGSTTFRLPRLGGHFLRALAAGQTVDAGRVAGSYQGDAIRNITGVLAWLVGIAAGTNVAGALYWQSLTSTTTMQLISTAGNGPANAVLDASRLGIPTASENRPVNIAWPCFIRYK